ncbi:hypothetical protein KP509_06G058200 [Ceratopteris richardii]|nr:hypothetical protein KP509_06G058200 [Ceratopteris richardii]
MQQPLIELTIMAAEGLKNVSFLRSRMSPFAVAFVEPYSKQSTRVLTKGGKDPVWNDSMQIAIPFRLLSDPVASLTLQVFNEGAIGTPVVGATQLLLQDLLRHAALKGNGEGDILTLQLFRPSGRPHGIIRIFLKLSGEGLPGLPRLLGEDLDVGCDTSSPATGIPVMPTMTIHNSAIPPEHPGEKYSYPYPAPSYVHSTYLPYPVQPSPRPSRSANNFLIGLVSGAVAAALLGSFFH